MKLGEVALAAAFAAGREEVESSVLREALIYGRWGDLAAFVEVAVVHHKVLCRTLRLHIGTVTDKDLYRPRKSLADTRVHAWYMDHTLTWLARPQLQPQ